MKKLIAWTLALVCMFCLTGCQTNFQKEQALMEKGPWASEAVWRDADSQMILVCIKTDDDVFANVSAFLPTGDTWQKYALQLYQGAPIVTFCTEEDDTVIEARAEMDGEDLYLYKFETDDETISLPYSDIKLSKFDYREQTDKLPFVIDR